MKYIQTNYYQNVHGITGRNPEERWGYISNHITPTHGVSIDVGSAEGYYTKKLVEHTQGKVISIEGSEFPRKIQMDYCANEIFDGQVILHSTPLTEDTINTFTGPYDYCLLLAVLHWCNNPNEILRKLSSVSTYTFVEIPELDDTICYGQDYLKYVRENFTDTKSYLEGITNKSIITSYKVHGATTPRTMWVIR